MKKDDCSLEKEELDNVKKHARILLNKADALGQFPTPVDHLVRTAKLVVNQNLSLGDNQNILPKFNSKLGKIARQPIHSVKKLLGLLHVPSGEILIDHSQHKNRIKFIKLHETGHGFLPHQKSMYEFMEDGEFEISPETNDLFERETNNFAAEVLFQLDTFEKIAADYENSIKTPIDLSKHFGASIYASMRRYVQSHFASLALGVYNLPKTREGGKESSLRRMPMYSPSFIKKFGQAKFPNPCNRNDFLGEILVSGKLETHHRTILPDVNGDFYEAALHVFSNSYEKFIMLIPLRKLSNKKFATATAFQFHQGKGIKSAVDLAK